jgi:hypothetical protein
MLNDLRQLLDDGLGIADDDVIHRAQFIVAHLFPKRTGADGGTTHFDLQRFTGLVAGGVIVLSRTSLAVVFRPHEGAADIDRLLIGIGA